MVMKAAGVQQRFRSHAMMAALNSYGDAIHAMFIQQEGFMALMANEDYWLRH
jgi:hypothetical protein